MILALSATLCFTLLLLFLVLRAEVGEERGGGGVRSGSGCCEEGGEDRRGDDGRGGGRRRGGSGRIESREPTMIAQFVSVALRSVLPLSASLTQHLHTEQQAGHRERRSGQLRHRPTQGTAWEERGNRCALPLIIFCYPFLNSPYAACGSAVEVQSALKSGGQGRREGDGEALFYAWSLRPARNEYMAELV